ncbi:MAG: L-glutamate gamma-semialdehyde dehydrogenase, partial [bacterium]
MSLPEFRNEAFTDFSSEAGRKAMLDGLRSVEAEFGKEFPLIIGGKRISSKEKFDSTDPSQKDRVVAICQSGT